MMKITVFFFFFFFFFMTNINKNVPKDESVCLIIYFLSFCAFVFKINQEIKLKIEINRSEP